MVDDVLDLETLADWSDERWMALTKGHDYRTSIAILPWK